MTDSPTPRIQCGDARDLDGVDDGAVNLVITSPPYNFGVAYDDYDDDRTDTDYEAILTDALRECYRVLADDGRIAVVAGIGTGRPLRDRPETVKACARNVGFSLRDSHIWDKGASEASSAWGSWRSASNPREIFTHEHILVFYKDHPGRKDIRTKTVSKDEFMTFVKSVWRVKPVSHDDHPAVFPPEIPYRLLQLHSYPGDTVLDPFCGSGTTCAVAAELDREAIGYDLSEEYVELARTRSKERGWLPDWPADESSCDPTQMTLTDGQEQEMPGIDDWVKAKRGGN